MSSGEPLSFSPRQMWLSDPMAAVFIEPMLARLEGGNPTGGYLRRCIGAKTVGWVGCGAAASRSQQAKGFRAQLTGPSVSTALVTSSSSGGEADCTRFPLTKFPFLAN